MAIGQPISPVGNGVINANGTLQTRPALVLLNQLRTAAQKVGQYGDASQYPLDPQIGDPYFDTAAQKLYVCNAVRAGATPATWLLIGP